MAVDTRPAAVEKRAARPSQPPGARHKGSAAEILLRIRNLPVPEQMQLAKRGIQMERAALERAFGKGVWEALLRNPRITHPEVAKIARKGALPRHLLEQMVDTPAWLTSPQVRRALLANRKLSRDMIDKVLRATPRSELKLVPRQMAYPPSVRESAERLLGG